MKQEEFLSMDEGLEHQEHLYLLEVLVNNIHIQEEKVPEYLLEPYGPLVVKAKFLDFPDLEFDQGKCPEEQDTSTEPMVAERIIAGAPKSWQIEQARDLPDFDNYPQYRVIIPIPQTMAANSSEETIRTLVPQSVVVTGEGLRYINAVLKTEVDPAILTLIQQQVAEEMKRSSDPEANNGTEYSFAAGKSLLFPMTPYKLIDRLRKTPLYLQVTRSGIYANDKPFFTLIGQVKLLLGNSFVKAIMVAGRTEILPVSAHIEDKYPISNVFGEETGTVSIFLRLSCFGKSMFDSEKHEMPSQLCPAQLPQGCAKKKFHPLYSDECDKPLPGIQSKSNDKYSKPVPWRKPWDELPEFRPPLPVLPAFYEPLPPLPPPPPPPIPFDMGAHLPNLPRCSPRQPPPCFRRSGDPPLSYCTKDMEAQIEREEMTKFTQTDTENQLKKKKSSPGNFTEVSAKVVNTELETSTMARGASGTECDGGGRYRPEKSQERGNEYDGNPEQSMNSKDDKTKLSSKKECTCPKIPDMLLPKQQCRCRCKALINQISMEEKIREVFMETFDEESKLTGRPEREGSEPKTSKNSDSEQTSDKKKNTWKETLKTSKNNEVFIFPGIDSSTRIVLPSSECGYDMRKYLRSMKEKGEYPDLRKYINPNPMAAFKHGKIPDEVKKVYEKELKKLEEKLTAKYDDSGDKPIAGTKKAIYSTDAKEKKDKSKKLEKKPVTKTDGGIPGDEKVSPISKTISKETVSTKKDQKEKAKIRASNIYEYTAGMYPGVHVGHKYCIRPLRLVPKTMGWLWNISDLGGALKPGRGWRPGAVRRNVNNLLQEWRKTNKVGWEAKPDQELDMMSNKISKRLKPLTPKSQGSKKDLETVKLNPTIHLHKKDRFYYVSMYPVRTESQEERGEDPQPIQFKIDRKHPDGRPSGDESCFSSTETSSDSSSYEVEYIAPAAMKQKKPKVEKIHMFQQYDEEDFISKKVIKKGAKPTDEQPEVEKKTEEKENKVKKNVKNEGGKKGRKKKK